jgi:hypothetical protein
MVMDYLKAPYKMSFKKEIRHVRTDNRGVCDKCAPCFSYLIKQWALLKLSGKRSVSVLVNSNTIIIIQLNHLKLPVGLLFSSYSYIIIATCESFSCCQEIFCYTELLLLTSVYQNRFINNTKNKMSCE